MTEREENQTLNAMKLQNSLIEELMLENKHLKKDRDYYKDWYDAHREEMDKGY